MNNPSVELVHRFFSGTGTTYDRMVHLWTIGLDARWKRRIIREIPAGPRRIVDQACGTGILTFQIAAKFPDCMVTGVELRDEYLNIAREKARSRRMENVEFILGRAEDVLLEDEVDCITSSYLAKYADLPVLVRHARQMLRDDGILIMHDFTYPTNPLFAAVWRLYFRFMQTFGSWKYPQWETIFHGLPTLLRETRWVPELNASLLENDFLDINIEPTRLGISAIVTARNR